MRTISTFIVLVLVAVLFTEAKTLKVPADYAKVQLAINAAVNGDTVLVAEGTYKENLVIQKKITLASLYLQDNDASHISKTILDGSAPTNDDSASVITIDGATDTTTMVAGFTIKGGKGNVRNSYRVGLGIDVQGGGITIRKNILTANNVSTPLGAGGVINISERFRNNKVKFVIVEENTIADNVVQASSAEGGALAIGQDCRIVRNKILRNAVYGTLSIGDGGAAQIWNGIITFEGNLIANNYASHWGGAIQANQVNAVAPIITFVNNIFAKNSAGSQGGALWLEGDSNKVFSINNTFVDNTSPYATAFYVISGSVRILNTIMWNPGDAEILSFPVGGRVSASYSDIRGISYIETGNIKTDPKFVANDSLYHLSNSSPCIGAGADSAFTAPIGTIMLHAPTVDYFTSIRPRPNGSKPDMGAVENDRSVPLNSVKDIADEIPNSFVLEQNYPNPFNPTTVISYQLPKSSFVILKIFDMLGREIETLVDEQQTAGRKEVQWNASTLSSGIYFYRLQAGSFVDVKKMLLLK